VDGGKRRGEKRGGRKFKNLQGDRRANVICLNKEPGKLSQNGGKKPPGAEFFT